jgi:hypothetical protein
MAELLQMEYVNRLDSQIHPMIRTFRNNNSVFKEENVAIHTAGSAESQFEEYERELQRLPSPSQLSDLDFIESQ